MARPIYNSKRIDKTHLGLVLVREMVFGKVFCYMQLNGYHLKELNASRPERLAMWQWLLSTLSYRSMPSPGQEMDTVTPYLYLKVTSHCSMQPLVVKEVGTACPYKMV